ncbi:MAG: class I SAM-dependent methyltransferase [Candidatus Methanomethylicaceae archaeon]
MLPKIGKWNFFMPVRRIRYALAYRYVRKYIKRYVNLGAGTYIADIGCGSGYLLGLLEWWFPQANYVGLDCDFKVLLRAKQETSRTLFVQGEAEMLPFKTSGLEFLIALHVIEHLYHPERFFEEAARVLEPGGFLLIATPNPAGLGARVMRSRWCGWRQDHVSLHPPREWLKIIQGQGFKSIRWGTTALSGIPAFRKFPLALLNYLPLVLFGILPWDWGEAFIGLFQREGAD